MPKTKTKKETVAFREIYPIQEPYVYAAITKEKETGRIRYEVIEPTLLEEERKKLKEIKKILMDEMDVSLKEIETREKAEEYLKNKFHEVIRNYKIKIAEEAIDKLLYYVIRDFLGYGS